LVLKNLCRDETDDDDDDDASDSFLSKPDPLVEEVSFSILHYMKHNLLIMTDKSESLIIMQYIS
jgi:hypothetical protein